MSKLFETLWKEPRAPGAREPFWRDWLLVGVLMLLAIAEGVLGETVVWRPLSMALTAALIVTLPWRRTHPLLMVTLAFGSTAVVQSIAIARGVDWKGLDTNAFMLILPYALLRWASGREAVLGLAVITISFATAVWLEALSWKEVLGASLFLLFPAALGASVRYQDSAQRRAREQVRLRERGELARELHDTVAHHVSAIAIQAQAGRTLAAQRTEAAVEALTVIEEAASRTLVEMRRIVGALRDDGEAARAPTATLADIERLARDDAFPLRVDVTLTGELDALDTSMQSTLYRLAQESVTNAVRHARGARSVSVRIEGGAGSVRLRVDDDGESIAGLTDRGFGLRGMSERVTLLGGTLHAGPGATRGWTVEAVLPKRESAS
jgi:signal transduction histidine kinase